MTIKSRHTILYICIYLEKNCFKYYYYFFLTLWKESLHFFKIQRKMQSEIVKGHEINNAGWRGSRRFLRSSRGVRAETFQRRAKRFRVALYGRCVRKEQVNAKVRVLWPWHYADNPADSFNDRNVLPSKATMIWLVS